MRYVNETKSPKYSSVADKLIKPGSSSVDLPILVDAVDKVLKGRGGLSIVLSDKDFAALKRLFLACGVNKQRLIDAMKVGRTDPIGEKKVYEQMESIYIAKKKTTDKIIKEHVAKEARINSESNFILPDGTPVGKEDNNVVQGMKVKEGTKIEPKIVEKPMSPLDILAHNAKISTERAQTAPLKGKAAVEAYKNKGLAPGVPNFPGIEKQMENLAREQAIANAQKAGIQQINTADMLASGAANNYGRK